MAYDVEILPPWRVPGRPTTDRCFVIADEGGQIRRPVTFDQDPPDFPPAALTDLPPFDVAQG
ncbi:hypothetical protein AB0J71_36025 [Nonomuraea sp. NPDC049637]|uniref:hypothetical protein n=1 Tax=Nonomuraea sp. NPDC049637 TaxID=3154356 RepID=UPI003445FA72